MIARNPHPVFAALWLVWLGNVIAATFLPSVPLYGLLVLLTFFVIEVPAAVMLNGGARDTLSEIATWVQRNTSKHRRFARGWNGALLAVILNIAWLTGRTFMTYSGRGIEGVVFGTGIGLCIVFFLWDHFVNPEEHG